ncbi:MAG: hypothetical protein U9N50_08270 [Pseudomonadota bacterium]|nr:hypothetical protein [Pseudomonadota bacterium]
MPDNTKVTFFLPGEYERKDWSVPADIYNLYRLLLNKSTAGSVFVPIRSMQFLAALDQHEIIFVDSLAYAVSDNQGGRVILISWKFPTHPERESLTEAVPGEVVYYARKSDTVQLRLATEFKQAMELMDSRYRDQTIPTEGARILPLKHTKP